MSLASAPRPGYWYQAPGEDFPRWVPGTIPLNENRPENTDPPRKRRTRTEEDQ